MNRKLQIIIFSMFTISLIAAVMLYLSDYSGFDFEFVILAILIIAAGVLYYTRRKGRADLVVDDEFSKKMLRVASSRSFYLSLYYWLLIMYISESLENIESAFGLGIAGMGLIFIINIVYIKYRGLNDQD